MPVPMNSTQTSSDNASGMAIRAVAGICRIGMTPGRLQRKMKMKRLSKNGVQPRPDLPRVCITMPSSMNSTVVSARFRAPVGAFFASAREASRKRPMPMSAEATAMSATLLKDGKMSCQRRISLIGGNTRPRSASTLNFRFSRGIQRGMLGQFVALRSICGISVFRPGCDSDSATYFISQKRRPR